MSEVEVEIQQQEYGGDDKSQNRKRKFSTTMVDDGIGDIPARLVKCVVLSLTKPSYVLRLGSKTVRAENRTRLGHLLRRLMRQHNWAEASGVLSVFLKGTCKDKSPITNRFKYLVLMELLEHMGGDLFNSTRIKSIFNVWMSKLGSMKDHPVQERFLVDMEFILFCFSQGNIEDAHHAALGLIQQHEFGRDPMSNMIVGLTFRHFWYSTIPKEMQWTESDEFYTTMQSNELLAYSEGLNDVNTQKVVTAFQCHSDTSVMNGKDLSTNVDNRHGEHFVGIDNMQIETLTQNFQPQDFYANSAENTGSEANHGEQRQFASSFFALEGFDSLLLPLRLPHATENSEELHYFHMQMLNNDYYKDAVKYLRLALYSTTPVLVALLPLIQLLLIGGQVDEALNELEMFCCDSNSALPIRIRAQLLEHVDRNNSAVLSTCFEDILKKDPTCCHSLAKLVSMHQNGDYSVESLLEMIAMRLDATYADFSIWREFALCFLKLSQQEEDRMSVCGNAEGHRQQDSVRFSKTPKIFAEGQSGKSWRLRRRWWLTRHFSHKTLESEILAGDFQLLTYKATCASHMYGEDFDYVLDVKACLEKQNEKDLLLFLQTNRAAGG